MKKLVLLMTLTLITFYQVSAQWSQLTSPTLEGTNINSFITAGPNILGISDGGVYRSSDNGLTWVYSFTGVNEPNSEVRNICKLGADVYIEIRSNSSSNSNIYKSTNNGINWSMVPGFGYPSNSSVEGLGSVNGRLIRIVNDYFISKIMMYYSTNGTSWSPGGIIYDYSSSSWTWYQLGNLSANRLYIISQDSIKYTTDGFGITPVSLSGLGSNSSFEYGYNLFGESNGTYFYYLSDTILYRYNTATNNWTTLSSSLFTGKQLNQGSATSNILMINAITFAPTLTGNILRSTDHGNTWTKINPVNFIFPYINSIHQTSASYVIANDLMGKMFYSNDTGTTWTKATGPYDAGADNLVAINNTLLFTNSNSNLPLGVARTTDGGQNWSYSNNGLISLLGDTNFVAASPIFTSGSNVFVICQTNFETDSNALFKSVNEGKSWSKVTTTPNYPVKTYLGNSLNTIFVRFNESNKEWTDTNSFIYRSTDFGATWQLVSSQFFTTYNFDKISGFSGNGDTVYVFGQLKNGDEAIYISIDNGLNWTFETSWPSYYFRIKTVSLGGANLPLVAWGGPTNPLALVVMDYSNYNTDSLSFGGGQGAIKGLPYPLRINSVVYQNSHWYIGTSKGVFASNDNCKTWSQKSVTGLFPNTEITSIAFLGRKIFLGTTNHGIWQATHSVMEAGSNQVVCNGNFVTLSAVTPGVDFTQWCCGLGTNPTVLFKPAATKTYTAAGKDIFNLNTIDSITVTVNGLLIDIKFTVNQKSFSSPPFNAQFTNLTTDDQKYNYLWLFGDDSTSTLPDPDHLYLHNGTYTVSLIATDKISGCKDTNTKVNYITCSGGSSNPCLIQPKITYTGNPLICENDSFLFTANIGTGYNYQWTLNNIAIMGANKYQFYAKDAGDYRVIIWDTSCSRTSNPQSLSHYPSVKPVILSSGQLRPCSTDSMQLYLATAYSSYKWSTGSTAQSIWIKNSGSYFVTVTNGIGCKVRSDYFNVNKSFLSVPEICMVTVDPTTKKNLVVWERSNTKLIKYYNIYKETVSAGVYALIGTQPYDSLSVFVDMGSNPAIRSDRYRISLVDTCDVESGLSAPHMTVLLQANMGTMGEKNLVWNSYEGFAFPSYRIYRGNSPSNIQLIATIASSYRSFTDTSKLPGLYFYQITLLKGDTCIPATKRAQTNAGPYSQSVSNMKDYSTTSAQYLTVDPLVVNLGAAAGSSAYIVVYTNLSTWDAVSSAPSWLDIVKSTGAGTIKVTAISAATGRTGYVTIKGSGVDSQVVEVNQGFVGIEEKIATNDLAVYPNPYSGYTNIVYNLAKAGNVRLDVYNMVGQKITEIVNGYQSAGNYKYQFSASATGQPDGVYFVLFNLDNKTTVRKIVELR